MQNLFKVAPRECKFLVVSIVALTLVVANAYGQRISPVAAPPGGSSGGGAEQRGGGDKPDKPEHRETLKAGTPQGVESRTNSGSNKGSDLNPNKEIGEGAKTDAQNTKPTPETLKAGTPQGVESRANDGSTLSPDPKLSLPDHGDHPDHGQIDHGRTSVNKTGPAQSQANAVPTKKFEFQNVPEKPIGNLLQGQLTNMQKVEYAMDVARFVKEYPFETHQTGGLSNEKSIQEMKIQDALQLLATIPVSDGDQLVEVRDERNAPKAVAEELIKGIPEGDAEAALKEAAKQAVTPSVVSDGTLLGQGHLNGLKNQLSEELNKYESEKAKSPPETPHKPAL